MENTFVLAFLFLFQFSPGGTYETHCSSGERLYTPRVGHDVCLPCPHGTFLAAEHHFLRECKPCTGIENLDVEVLVSACNSTNDAVILCTGGFYRRRARNIRQKNRCEKCTECSYPARPARPCEGYYNTVCCPPNHDAVMTPDGWFVCKKRPIVCGARQFFNTSSEECLPRPAGTFMSDHSHTYKDCLTCEELSENNLTQAVITKPCSRTTPTLFGCKAGYFRDPTQESLHTEVSCTPCRFCDRHLTDCDMFHDAVCDDEDRMVSTAPTNLIVSKGLTKDTENRVRGTFVPTDTLQGHERNECNRSQNGVTDCQTSVPTDVSVYLYVAVFVISITILIVAFVACVCTDKPDTEHSHSNVACSRFKTPRIVIVTVLFILLSVSLIFCALLKTGVIEASHDASTAWVVTTEITAGVYVITVIFLIIRPHKSQDNEERQPLKSQDNEEIQSLKSQGNEERQPLKSQNNEERQSLKSQDNEERQSLKSQDNKERQSLKSQDNEEIQSLKSQDNEERQPLKSQDNEERQSLKSQDNEERQSLKSQDNEERQPQKSQDTEERQPHKSQDNEERQPLKSQDNEERQKLKSQDNEERQQLKSQDNEERQQLKSQDNEERRPRKSHNDEERRPQTSQDNTGTG